MLWDSIAKLEEFAEACEAGALKLASDLASFHNYHGPEASKPVWRLPLWLRPAILGKATVGNSCGVEGCEDSNNLVV